MKLRIKGNNIRLRLTQTEVEALCNEGKVNSDTMLPGQEVFAYSLKVDPQLQDTMEAEMRGREMQVRMNYADLSGWAENARITYEAEQQAEGKSLTILVEKDFKCLVKREGEDESDHYPNPLAAKD